MATTKKKKSVLTTIFGILAGLGQVATLAPIPPHMLWIPQVVSAIGVAGLGVNARDNKVTSEDVGAKPKE